MRFPLQAPLGAFTSWASAAFRARRAAFFLCLFAVLPIAGGLTPVCGQSALDGFDPNANDAVRVVVAQPDGKILLGGAFTTLSPNGAAPVTRNHIARLNADGTLDTAFNPNADDLVYAIAVQANGKILLGGLFTTLSPSGGGAVTRSHIARLNADGTLDTAFDPNADGIVNSIAVQANGQILAGGFFTTIGGETRNFIARLDATTGLADSFDPSASAVVSAITVQADGKILLGGSFTSVGGQPRNHIARLDAGSGLADSFDPNASHAVVSIAIQADGKILAAGQFMSIGGQPRNRIARLDAVDGSADSFDPSANQAVFSIAVQPDGKILAGGLFTTLAPNGGTAVTRNSVARLEVDGSLDQTLNLNAVGGPVQVFVTALQPDGKILIGGGFDTVLGVPRNNIARLNPDGTLDTGFDPNANGSLYAIAVQADGKILAGGSFTSIGGQSRLRIARLNATTGLADSFDPNASGSVRSIAVQADGKILVGGTFSGANSIGGQTRNHIARLEAATGLADSFDPNANGDVISIAVQADGRILVGGGFFGGNSIGGQFRNYIARLDPVTGLADAFNPHANGAVASIAIQADGKILAGGFFTSIGGLPRNYIARLDAASGLPDAFDPNATERVESIVVQADGKILVGGSFTSIGGQARRSIARLEATSGLADSFDPSPAGLVFSIALQADGKILVGGGFGSIGGQPRNSFARLGNDTAALQDLAVTQSTVTWTRGGSSPQFTRVTFEFSTDNVNYAPLGNGMAAGSNWILTGLSLPTGQNSYIRARGYYRSGYFNGSESIIESVRNAFIAGSTASPTPTPTGTPTLTPTPTPTPTPTVTPSPTPAAQSINLSTRMRVQTGDRVGIGGFIITGTAPKHVLLQAIGPSLTQSGVPDALADPMLELHGPGAFVTIINNNWRDDPVQEAAIIASGIPPTDDLESAIDAPLAPGVYTAIIRDNGNTSGVALIEVYDLNPPFDSKLANISTRAFVGTGDNIVIGGFFLGGNNGADRIVLRGIGPSLVVGPDALADPTLELRDGDGALLVSNNDWQDDPAQAAELIAAGLAPTNPLESGIAATLPPGPYTALLAGLNNGTGIGLVEVYDLGGP